MAQKDFIDFSEFDRLYSGNEPRLAVNAGQALVQVHPGSAMAHYKFALALSKSGQIVRALGELSRAEECGGEALSDKIERARVVLNRRFRKAQDDVAGMLVANSLLLQEFQPERRASTGNNDNRPLWFRADLLLQDDTDANLKKMALWRLIHAHADEQVIRLGHPMRDQKVLNESELIKLGIAEIRFAGNYDEATYQEYNRTRRQNKKRALSRSDYLISLGAPLRGYELLMETREQNADKTWWWSKRSNLAIQLGKTEEGLSAALVRATLTKERQDHFRAAILAEQLGRDDIAIEQYAHCVRGSHSRGMARLRLALLIGRDDADREKALRLLEPYWSCFDATNTLRRRLLPSAGPTETGEVEDHEPDIVDFDAELNALVGKATYKAIEKEWDLTTHPERVRRLAFETAVKLIKVGEFASAQTELWKLALTMEQHDEEVFTALAYVYAAQGRDREALALYEASPAVPSPFMYEVDAVGVRQQNVYRYLELIELLDLQDNVWLWESHFGRRIDCNPYAIFRKAQEQDPAGEAIHVWVANAGAELPADVRGADNVVVTPRESEGYWLAMAVAKYMTNNASFSFEYMHREGQVHVNTWHGTPLKFLGRDDLDSPYDYGNVGRNFIHATQLFMSNRFTADVMVRHYDVDRLVNGDVRITGYARNDALINQTDEESHRIRQQLGFEGDDLPIVLYAPTWRGSSKSQKFDVDKLVGDLVALGESKKWHLVFRGHPLSAALLENIDLPVTVAPADLSTYQLMALADVVVTDYSSLGIDQLATGRPVVYYVYDLEEYSAERGLYFDASEFPGLVVPDLNELIVVLGRLVAGEKVSGVDWDAAREDFVPADDGRVAERCLYFMKKDTGVIPCGEPRNRTGRRRLMIHHPALTIDSSETLKRSLESIDFDAWDVTLVLDHAEVALDPTLPRYLDSLPAEVRVLPRKGGMVAKVGERRAVNALYAERAEPLTTRERDLYTNALMRESYRLFGNNAFDTVIEWGGQSAFWSGLLGLAVEADHRVLILDEDLSGERMYTHPLYRRAAQFWDVYDQWIVADPHSAAQAEIFLGSKLTADVIVKAVWEPRKSPLRKIIDAEFDAVYRGGIGRGFNVRLLDRFAAAIGSDFRIGIVGTGHGIDAQKRAEFAGLPHVMLIEDNDPHAVALSSPERVVFTHPHHGVVGALDAIMAGIPVFDVSSLNKKDLKQEAERLVTLLKDGKPTLTAVATMTLNDILGTITEGMS